ncbi:DUF6036 family nucleotidyltransferase [Priestia filamentosa]|uniref:DUF6036 family nucleotidyltransferase n=1 Tax=Priestia filamentosa TaxID=1402861 RepID=UPI003981C8B9
MNVEIAREEINSLDPDDKYNAMLQTAAIITKLLEGENIKPIIVGGLSVEIYTQNDYATRDIDFVSDGYEKISEVLLKLGFSKEGRHFVHGKIEIAVEIPSSDLEGDYDKVNKVEIEEGKYVYLISLEDIIIDRLRAAVHWKSEQDTYWGFKLLAKNFNEVNIDYLFKRVETKSEKDELSDWIDNIKRDIN